MINDKQKISLSISSVLLIAVGAFGFSVYRSNWGGAYALDDLASYSSSSSPSSSPFSPDPLPSASSSQTPSSDPSSSPATTASTSPTEAPSSPPVASTASDNPSSTQPPTPLSQNTNSPEYISPTTPPLSSTKPVDKSQAPAPSSSTAPSSPNSPAVSEQPPVKPLPVPGGAVTPTPVAPAQAAPKVTTPTAPQAPVGAITPDKPIPGTSLNPQQNSSSAIKLVDSLKISRADVSQFQFAGIAPPKTPVHISVHSKDPIIIETTADSQGKWTYTLKFLLQAGVHTLRVTTIDPMNKNLSISAERTFFIGDSKAGESLNGSHAALNRINRAQVDTYYTLFLTLLLALIAGSAFSFVQSRTVLTQSQIIESLYPQFSDHA